MKDKCPLKTKDSHRRVSLFWNILWVSFVITVYIYFQRHVGVFVSFNKLAATLGNVCGCLGEAGLYLSCSS